MLCKVYTGYCDTIEIEHGLCACTVDYLSVQAHKPCSISHLDATDGMKTTSIRQFKMLVYFNVDMDPTIKFKGELRTSRTFLSICSKTKYALCISISYRINRSSRFIQ